MRVLQDSRACLCSGRLKEPAGFDIVKQRGRGNIISQYWTRNITLISPSYAMLSLSSVAYIDEELCHTVNTGLHCQFKMRSIEGTLVSSMFCADSRSSQRTPVQAPGSSQLSSKRFPSQRSNHLPNDRPLGAQIQGQVQSRVLGEAGRERRERKRENEGNVGKKEEK